MIGLISEILSCAKNYWFSETASRLQFSRVRCRAEGLLPGGYLVYTNTTLFPTTPLTMYGIPYCGFTVEGDYSTSVIVSDRVITDEDDKGLSLGNTVPVSVVIIFCQYAQVPASTLDIIVKPITPCLFLKVVIDIVDAKWEEPPQCN